MSTLTKNKKLWVFWIVLMIASIGYFSGELFKGKDKSMFMPGPLTSGHHQIGVACESCHADDFSTREDLQKQCISCHGDQRKKPFDSHPKAKFTDPRNADRLENINAVECVTCHVEHQPHTTHASGLTQPLDFCIHCHSDVAEERPTHEGMEFDTCASAGCHNYHNNRSLYTDFLIKHIDESENLKKQSLPEKEYSKVLDEIAEYPHRKYPVKALQKESIDAPEKVEYSEQVKHDWLTTAHAKSGVNCSACHAVASKDKDAKAAQWINKPDHTSCTSCHNHEVEHFLKGKHGMRLSQDLSAMTPEMARLPMKEDALDKELNCNTCHQAHRYESKESSVEVCLECHNDQHSLAYKDSPHYELWQQETAGQAAANTGVSCASCHMPRVNYDTSEWLRRIMVEHNQNANLRPNEKMIRSVCGNCHGLEFTLDALADEELIRNNFNGKPSVHVESMDLIRKELQRRKQSGRSQ